jgi:hypothetical protein
MVVNEPVIGGLAVPTTGRFALGYNCTNHAKGYYSGLDWIYSRFDITWVSRLQWTLIQIKLAQLGYGLSMS